VTDCGRIVLDDAAAAFLCRLVGNHSAGDQQLLIGEIEAFSYDTYAPPIAFCRGRYGAFRPTAEGPQAEAPDLWPSAISDIGWG
jgi:flavin reductase (DIM6/NTAB) family NADH-FMN oxidoreductase RutF